MKRWIALCMVLALALILCACENKNTDADTEPQPVVISSTTVTTPYAELTVPENYQGNVQYTVESGDSYVMTFFAVKDDAKLFSLIFNGEGEILLGTIIGEEYTTLYATVFPLSEQDAAYMEKAEYQEGMYTILTYLRREYDFEDNMAVEKPEFFAVKTDVVTLYYPKKWQDRVDYEIEAGSVTFSSDGTVLFVISFVDDGGYCIGKYQGHPIYLTLGSLSGVDPDSEEYHELSVMQDDVNLLLDTLRSDPAFSSD